MEAPVKLFLDRYKSHGLTGSRWSARKVKALERHLGLVLPASYQAYLRIAGKAAPPGLLGSDCHGGYLFDLRDWAEELLSECGNPFELAPSAVVFMMHQGYQFWYFDADGLNGDPPVYYYFQGRTTAERKFEHFSGWVLSVV